MARPVLTKQQREAFQELIENKMTDQWLEFRSWIERSDEVQAVVGEENQTLLDGEEFIWEPLQDMFSTPESVMRKILERLRAAQKYWRV